ncbi:hypothetical protein [Lutibaculum baratangense]|uniref:Uncharacterized protein n=1 Tax=Lutibaculum baratangense AMV1 TaxID=631454 RepID=V4T9W1_9HYPH|nr:hypothetical protein [Lutibaculum baratangense]ESR23283.1 hypothetical protein N177_3351 [Lutibaculum baratangense AMV1]
MKVLRLILPILTCYAADLVVFDGQYFGRFAMQFEAVAAANSLTGAGSAFAGAWRPPDPGAYLSEAGLCRIDKARFAC